MKEVTLDFSSCSNWWDVHELLKDKLEFPDFYGKNLDALWDLLTGYIEIPITINIHLASVQKGAMHEVGKVLAVMKEFAQYDDGITINYR